MKLFKSLQVLVKPQELKFGMKVLELLMWEYAYRNGVSSWWRITGLESGAVYIIESVSYDQPNSYPNDEFKANQYNDNANFETEADAILDFSEGNPFGTF